MNEKKTPIPLRAHRKKSPEPKPLIFPQTHLVSPATDVIDLRLKDVIDAVVASTELRNLVAKWVAQALYKTAMRMTEYEIVEMGESQFEAFIRSILEDE